MVGRAGCKAAFIQLLGQEGVSARVSRNPPGKSLPPVKFALDEIVYVCSGRGLTTVWAGEGKPKKSFEWQEHSMFLVPRNHYHVFSNMQGDKPVRLFHYSYMPMAMSALPEPDMYFNNPYESKNGATDGDFYSEAKMVQAKDSTKAWACELSGTVTSFPTCALGTSWTPTNGAAPAARAFLSSSRIPELTAHMSVFAPKTYKKAHRHGPGRAIIIPAGEGYSIMWEEGKEKIVCPWHECSMVTPPNKWFHQHFNAGGDMARYLALHPPMQFHGHAEKIEDRAKDQIEYPNERSAIFAEVRRGTGQAGHQEHYAR